MTAHLLPREIEMNRYEAMKQAVTAARHEQERVRNFEYADGWHQEVVGGVRFQLKQLRQSRNEGRAIQTLHYVEGKKVSKRFFFDAAASLGANLLEEVSRG
jgi:hypothetical protein